MESHEILLCRRTDLERLPALSAPLTAWYRAAARDLPWRGNPSPYQVWISEIMLQQTRVEAVKDYYRRFLEALPTVADLAAVEEEKLLKLWEGLGYYSRARNLHRAAKEVMARHDGALPASYAQLLALPGIGEYTAGAVASIAFGIPVPAVDGNVYRVLSRILGSYADTSRPEVKRAFREAAASLLEGASPGELNQALMELGATVCLPNGEPLCARCPVKDGCNAQAEGNAAELPVKAAKKPRRVEERTIVLVVSGQGVLLRQRASTGLLPGLYEPINLEGRFTREQVGEMVGELGGKAERIIPLAAAKHIFTHVEWRMEGYLVYTPPFDPGQWLWADREGLARYAVPSAFRAYKKDLGRYLEGV